MLVTSMDILYTYQSSCHLAPAKFIIKCCFLYLSLILIDCGFLDKSLHYLCFVSTANCCL